MAFDLTHGDLDVAAMSLSNSFLAMDARHLPAITDLKAQLLEKFKHCDQIVRVISQAGYIDRVKRKKLAKEVELMMTPNVFSNSYLLTPPPPPSPPVSFLQKSVIECASILKN